MNTLSKYVLMAAMTATAGASAIAADTSEKAAQKPHAGWHEMTPEQMREHVAKRQATLHDQLKLTPAQEPAWKNFVAASTPTDMDKQRGDRAAMEKMSAPERLEKHLQATKEREARMTSRLAALKTFYAALTPQQQQVLNQQTMHGGRHHGHHEHHEGETGARG